MSTLIETLKSIYYILIQNNLSISKPNTTLKTLMILVKSNQILSLKKLPINSRKITSGHLIYQNRKLSLISYGPILYKKSTEYD